jgi:hypothetical protein
LLVGICFSGQIRTFARCWQSIDEFVLGPLAPHEVIVFAATASDQSLSAITPLFPKLEKLAVDRDRPLGGEVRYPDRHRWRLGDSTGHVDNLLHQLRRLSLAYELYESFVREQDRTAAWLLRIRFDLEFESPIEDIASLKPDRIYIPKTDNWCGYNDRFAIGPAALMAPYFLRDRELPPFYDRGGTLHAESFLKHVLDAAHIPVGRTSAVCRIVRPDGSHASTVARENLGDIVDS